MKPVLPRLLFALPLFALAACGESKTDEAAMAAGEPTAPSSEWVAENPTEPAVPVTLPDTPMTNTPQEPVAPAAK